MVQVEARGRWRMEIDFRAMTPGAPPAPFYQDGTVLLSQDQAGGPILQNYAIVSTGSSMPNGYDASYTTTCYLGMLSARVSIEVMAYGEVKVSSLANDLSTIREETVQAADTPHPINFREGDAIIRALRIDASNSAVVLRLAWTEAVKAKR
jgi:hypothetical protein